MAGPLGPPLAGVRLEAGGPVLELEVEVGQGSLSFFRGPIQGVEFRPLAEGLPLQAIPPCSHGPRVHAAVHVEAEGEAGSPEQPLQRHIIVPA